MYVCEEAEAAQPPSSSSSFSSSLDNTEPTEHREGFSVCYKASKQPLKTFGRVHTTEGLLRYASSSSFHTLAARR